MEIENSGFISPLFYLGIFLCIVPIFGNLFHITKLGMFYKIGIGIIILGAIHTMYKRR